MKCEAYFIGAATSTIAQIRYDSYEGVAMIHIKKRYIVDEDGNPKEVVILLDDYKKIEELLGLDLDRETVKQLRDARKDRDSGNKAAYVDLDSI
jgi:hypothetical protein